MNKNTILAILFSTLIVLGSFYIQARFFPPPTQTQTTQEGKTTEESTEEDKIVSVIRPLLGDGAETEVQEERRVQLSTNIFDVEFSNKNAVIKSLSRKRIIDGEQVQVELIPNLDTIPSSSSPDTSALIKNTEAFRVFFSEDYKNKTYTDVYFDVRRTNDKTVIFSKDFVTKEEQTFTLEKHFIFADNEDVFEVEIKLKNSENKELSLGGDTAYILEIGPQVGPTEEVLLTASRSRQISRRWFVTLLGGKKVKNINNVRAGKPQIHEKQYQWTGMAGRYFSLLVLTNGVGYKTQFATEPVSGLFSGAQMSFLRPAIQSSAITDRFRVYVGPSSGPQLKKYNTAESNSLGLADAQFDKIKSRRLLTFLERPMTWTLNMFYSLIPNYGIAIILLTILVRVVTYPVMRKSKVNGERMKTLSPKMEAIKKQFSDDTARQSKEIMELYKREKFSPLSSFMPMLIQFPFFIAMYRVIYESFDLWRQPFFGWIGDLSQPDVLVSFGGYTVPIINWTGLHLLPIVMVGTQFFSSLILTKQQQQQQTAGAGKGMMMFLSYGFPFIIFFVLYNSPSGLILYWIISNLFTIITFFDKPKLKPVVNKPVEIKNTRVKSYAQNKISQKKVKRKKTLLEKMQEYVDKNTQGRSVQLHKQKRK